MALPGEIDPAEVLRRARRRRLAREAAPLRPKLNALGQGHPRATPVAVVAAHPDDETLSAAAVLGEAADLTLIHLTDGAPARMDDARRGGFATREGYAAARAAELSAALETLGARPTRRGDYGVVDQECALHLARIAERLAGDLEETAAVFTHPYEGGHPDHDAAAFAVQAACALLRREGRPAPARYEFASYHLADGGLSAGRFWPDPRSREAPARLDQNLLARKRAAAGCFVSQAPVIAGFPLETERYRPAPTYDFTRPPPPGEALYDRFDWDLTSEAWRGHARAALVELALEPRR